jgi:hypothetical protein
VSNFYDHGYRLGKNLKAGPGAEPHNSVLVAALRYYPEEARREVIRGALDGRRYWLNWTTATAREWGRKCSRRPARNNHHDSWTAREKYVRGCDRLPASDVARAARVWEEAYGPGVRSRIQAA